MSRKRWRGVVLIYAIVAMIVFIAFVSLGVDLGRAQKAKTELQIAADGAARNGAQFLFINVPQAQGAAISTASANNADGSPVTINPLDIEFGTWSTTNKSFTVLSGLARINANAIHITADRTAAKGTGIPLLFGGLFGRKTIDVTAGAIAMQTPGVNVDQWISGTSNPFLSGMPAGSSASNNNPHHNPDYAGTTASPKQMPLPVGMPVIEGAPLTFDNIAGTVGHDPDLPDYQPDGQLNDIGHNNPTPNGSNSYSSGYYNENGIADVRAPINALVGVFLDDSQPDKTAAPSNLDFSSDASRDFSTLKPDLKQTFFIGDGLNSKGAHQQFIVPKGATRLFLATWDFYEWNNNYGSREVKVSRPKVITTVR